MGIIAISFAVQPYVSDYDPYKNSVVVNEAELAAWDKSTAKGKGARPDPEYAHGPQATKWLLGALDSITMGLLADELTSIGDGNALVLRNADNDIMAARFGLKGWENFNDEDGNPVPFTTEMVPFKGGRHEVVSAEAIKLIPVPVLREIGREVKSRNSVSAVQAKNSASASSL